MFNFLLKAVNLHLFEGGDGAASGESTSSDAAGQNSGDDLKNVVYGTQADNIETNAADPGAADPNTSSEDRAKAFSDLINGEYKDLFTKETQKIIDKRFKQTKTLEDSVNKNKPILDMLYQKYKITDGDSASLLAAIEDDDSYWEEAADEAGMSVKQYKEFSKLKRRNSELEAERNQKDQQDRTDAQLRQWYLEADNLKKTFPNFNLESEAKNPEFVNLLRHGVPVEHAYKVIHMDEIVTDAMRTTASAAEKRVTNNVRARGNRPAENGRSNQSGFTVKSDVHKLTKADRAEIARRASRGESISF